jgi:hypothetical protein
LTLHKAYLDPSMLSRYVTGKATWTLLQQLLRNLHRRRRQMPPDAGSLRFFDVRYVDLVDSPVETLRKLYVGTTFGKKKKGGAPDEELRKRWEEYLGRNKQGQRGRARYLLDDFGLSEKEMQTWEELNGTN